MEKIQKSIEVDRPIRSVYNQWTQFEEFPRFMEGVKQVKQLDDKRLHWLAEIGGKEKEWTAKKSPTRFRIIGLLGTPMRVSTLRVL